jgi:predicted amidohydrolase YtcJ
MREVCTVVIACLAILGTPVFAAETPPPAADTVLTNGKVYTLDSSQPWAEAVAISAGKLIYVGSASGAKAHVGSATKVMDLGGRYVQPGIVDAHVHPIMGGLKSLYECNFGFTATPDEIAKTLSACAKRLPEGQWIRGGQWGSAFFEVNDIDSPRAFLDRISTKHPIYLMDDSAHNAWVNSAVLARAGIDRTTADPAGGTIVRGPDGQPNGVLLEGAARLIDAVLPKWSDEQYVAAAREAARLANGYGITGIKDAGLAEPAGKSFGALDRNGELTLNVAVCAFTQFGARTSPLDYGALEAERDRYRSPHVHTEFVKIFLDGVPTPARTAAMIAPYVPDSEHGDKFTGGMHVPQDVLTADVVELDRRGFTVKIHAAGDRSVRAALDAVEAARKANGASGLRHEVAHASFIDPADVPRFAKLDTVADYSPIIWYRSSITEAVVSAVGKGRGERMWPTRDLLDSGATIAAGSDWPAAVPDQNPWSGIEALVTRRDPSGGNAAPFWPEQAVTLEEAMRIYTINGARALRLEQQTGSLEVGKSADLIVLDRNPFTVPIEQVGDVKVLLTMFEGRQVYGAEPGRD